MACVVVPIVGNFGKTAEWILIAKRKERRARIKAIKGS